MRLTSRYGPLAARPDNNEMNLPKREVLL
jgi:hypothetical protein